MGSFDKDSMVSSPWIRLGLDVLHVSAAEPFPVFPKAGATVE